MTSTDYKHSETTRAVLRSLVPVICPPEAVHLADAIVDHLALTLAASPAIIQRGLAAGLVTYDAGAILRYGKRARFLVGEQAERYYASWEHGLTPVQVQLAKALNQLISLSCYEQPEMMERLGFRPAPWIEEVRQKRLTVYADDVAKQEASVIAPDPLPAKVAKGARGW